jgi:hypothetical protein
MNLRKVYTLSGNKTHYTDANASTLRTLCGREVSNSSGDNGDMCKRCQSKADKVTEQRDRLEYATRAAETQDDVMSQADVTPGRPATREEHMAVLRMMANDAPDDLTSRTVIGVCPGFHADEPACGGDMVKAYGLTECSRCGYTPFSGEELATWERLSAEREAREEADFERRWAAVGECEECLYANREHCIHVAAPAPVAEPAPVPMPDPIVNAPQTAVQTPSWVLVDTTTNTIVEADTDRKSFRGDTWRIMKISRTPEGNSEGRVLARQGSWVRDLYPSVFELKIVRTITQESEI